MERFGFYENLMDMSTDVVLDVCHYRRRSQIRFNQTRFFEAREVISGVDV